MKEREERGPAEIEEREEEKKRPTDRPIERGRRQKMRWSSKDRQKFCLLCTRVKGLD